MVPSSDPSPSDPPPHRHAFRLSVSRSAIWLAVAIMATALLTAAALVSAGT